jgi:hypothetical protein
MDKKQSIEYLKERLGEIPTLASLPYNNDEYPLWRNQIEDVLKAVFGRDSDEHERVASAYLRVSSYDQQGDYLQKLKLCEIAILSIIKKYETLGFEAEPATVAGLPPQAFIAHEGETQALTSLKEFLDALGIKYFIAESEASGGKSVEKHVNWVEEQGDFAIILATKGKAIDKKTGKHYMGLNVADELGSARQIYGNHIILLVQKGVQVHTNKKEIVYGEFTSTNMQEAFIKIARELRNWGFIKVGKVK